MRIVEQEVTLFHDEKTKASLWITRNMKTSKNVKYEGAIVIVEVTLETNLENL